MAGVIWIPWYATVMRADRLEAALVEIAPVALRYGALDYEVQRSRDDSYRFWQTAMFERKIDFTRYWDGPEFRAFRVRHSGWFQIPVTYGWYDRVTSGQRGGAEQVPPAA